MFIPGKPFQHILSNTIAYYENPKITDVESFITLGPGHNIYLVTDMINNSKSLFQAKAADPQPEGERRRIRQPLLRQLRRHRPHQQPRVRQRGRLLRRGQVRVSPLKTIFIRKFSKFLTMFLRTFARPACLATSFKRSS